MTRTLGGVSKRSNYGSTGLPTKRNDNNGLSLTRKSMSNYSSRLAANIIVGGEARPML